MRSGRSVAARLYPLSTGRFPSSARPPKLKPFFVLRLSLFSGNLLRALDGILVLRVGAQPTNFAPIDLHIIIGFILYGEPLRGHVFALI